MHLENNETVRDKYKEVTMMNDNAQRAATRLDTTLELLSPGWSCEWLGRETPIDDDDDAGR